MINSWDARTVCMKGPFTFEYAHTSFSLMPTLKSGFIPAHPQILFCGAVSSHQLHLRSLERTPQLVSLGPALRASGRRGSGRSPRALFGTFLWGRNGWFLRSLAKGAETLPLLWINILSLWPQYVFCDEVVCCLKSRTAYNITFWKIIILFLFVCMCPCLCVYVHTCAGA